MEKTEKNNNKPKEELELSRRNLFALTGWLEVFTFSLRR